MANLAFRGYQSRAIDSARTKLAASIRRIILNAPTGAGKTVIATGIIHLALARGKRILFVAHRRELIDQCCEKLEAGGITDYGVIMAGSKRIRPDAPVQVASIQTLVRRQLPPADLIIIDEAHRAVSRSYLNVTANYPRAAVIGLSATPERLDGKGLDQLFDDMVVVETVPNLIEQGFLVRPVGYEGPRPDLSGVRTRRGDYDESELAEAMDRPKLVGDIVRNWKRLASGRKTVAFAASVEHARHIAKEFWAAGVPAAAIDGGMRREARESVLADWRGGQLQVVANCMILTEGFDFPELSCAILARPTKSESLYLQMAGRIMRTAPGKSDAVILDHGGCWAMHGGPHIAREWSLEGASARSNAEAPEVLKCPSCDFLHDPNPTLWLGESQDRLRSGYARAVGKTKAARALSPCPRCATASCRVCEGTFTVQTARTAIEDVAWTVTASCPHCHAEYTDDVGHLIGGETESKGIPETTSDDLVRASDEAPEGVRVRAEYKRLMAVARAKGFKRGWAFWKLKGQFSDESLREHLPRHTGNWWRAQA